MLVEIKSLWDVYLSHKENNLPLVLATIVNTTGSSYKKRGAMMLIQFDKTTHGMLSGGCLEADLAEYSVDVFETGQPIKVTYDLSDDSIFGLGAGCEGSIDVVLQIIQGDYLPFSGLNPNPNKSHEVELIIQSTEDKEFALGSFSLLKQNVIIEHPNGFNRFANKNNVQPMIYGLPPRVAVFGAGRGSLPLCQLINTVFWHGSSIDYRQSLLTTDNFPAQWKLIHSKQSELTTTLKEGCFDAIVIMSHNIEKDAACLKSAYQAGISFIGLLGSIQRRDKVLKKTGLTFEEVKSKLRAPVGLNIGGNLPENIAVSIVAELQKHFYLQ
jgi:xanthine/CO dehydrogenase XdhC/CoxF family maturation factor